MTSNTRFRPDFSSGRIDVPDVGGILIDFADRQANRTDKGLDRALKQQQLDEEQRRWDITNARSEAEWNRKQQEQKAADTYYNEIAKGTQLKSGILNDPELIAESAKYALTPQEIEMTKTYGTSEDARKAGQTALADKMLWQEKLSNAADLLPSTDYGRESRIDMYERAMGKVNQAGLPVLPGMVTSLDQARLAMREEEKNKTKTIDDRINELEKQKTDLTKWAITAQPGSGQQAVVDDNGNVTGYTNQAASTLNRNSKNYNDDMHKGAEDIAAAVSKLKGTPESKQNVLADVNKTYNELLKENKSPSEAAALAIFGLGQKSNDEWYKFGFGDPEATFNTAELQRAKPYFDERVQLAQDQSRLAGTNNGTTPTTGTTKGDLAERLAVLKNTDYDNELAKLRAQREALLKGENARGRDELRGFLQQQGVLPPEAPVSQTTTSVLKDTKVPQSLVQAEGVRNKPYKNKGEDFITVGVGYAFNKDRSEIESDFKAAGIPLEKIDGLMKQDGTELTNKEVASLADVSYDRHGVQKLKGIGIDIGKINPTLAEIGVSQAFRGDIVKNGDDYRGKLYEFLKNDDLAGMINYVKTSKEVPKEVKQRINLVTDRYGAMTKEQATYEGIPTGTSTTSIRDLFTAVPDNRRVIENTSTRLESDPILQSLEERAKTVSGTSKEYQDIQKEYNDRREDIIKSSRGLELSNYMNRQVSSPEMEKVNKAIIDTIKNSPEVLRDLGASGKESVIDMQRLLMQSGNKGKELVQAILNRLNTTRTLESKNVIPSRPIDYKQ